MPADCARRATAIGDLVERFAAYVVEHRDCRGLAGSILEVTVQDAPWGIAWLRCPECGVRWERRLALSVAS